MGTGVTSVGQDTMALATPLRYAGRYPPTSEGQYTGRYHIQYPYPTHTHTHVRYHTNYPASTHQRYHHHAPHCCQRGATLTFFYGYGVVPGCDFRVVSGFRASESSSRVGVKGVTNSSEEQVLESRGTRLSQAGRE